MPLLLLRECAAPSRPCILIQGLILHVTPTFRPLPLLQPLLVLLLL
jgi:hypothetical protein